MQGAGMGYCPVSSLGHDTMGLYRDTAGMGAEPGATIRPAGLRYGRPARKASGARARVWLLGECVAIQ